MLYTGHSALLLLGGYVGLDTQFGEVATVTQIPNSFGEFSLKPTHGIQRRNRVGKAEMVL
jgi:hypothetical protein